MFSPDGQGLTQLISAARAGDAEAIRRAGPIIYGAIRAVAEAHGRGRVPGQTLEMTDLVSEVYLRLFGRPKAKPWTSRAHFLAFTATAVRSILVDHARRRNRRKRSVSGSRVPLDDIVAKYERRSGNLEDLDRALSELAASNPSLARIIELKFFAGLTLPEIAHLEQLPLRTLERHLQMARGWLRRELRHGS